MAHFSLGPKQFLYYLLFTASFPVSNGRQWLLCLKFSFSFSYILSSETVGVWGYLGFRRWASQILEAYSLRLAFKSDIVFPPSFSFFFLLFFISFTIFQVNLYPTKYILTYSLLITVCFWVSGNHFSLLHNLREYLLAQTPRNIYFLNTNLLKLMI